MIWLKCANFFSAQIVEVTPTGYGRIETEYAGVRAEKSFHITKKTNIFYEDPDNPGMVTWAKEIGLGEDLRPCDGVECAKVFKGAFCSFNEYELQRIRTTAEHCGFGFIDTTATLDPR